MSAMATEFGKSRHWALEARWVVLAIVGHAVFLGAMPGLPGRSPVVAPGDAVDLSFMNEDTEVEEAEPAPPPPTRMLRRTKRRSRPKVTPPARRETPAAFDNVVLTEEAEGESSWSVEEGSGKSVEGPIGSPDAAVTGESKMGGVGGRGRGVVIDTGDLSREQFAPPLNRTPKPLEADDTGAVGVEGEAFVRLQLSAEGVPSDWQVIAETPRGYALGEACIKTLQEEAWQAPLDHNGKPVTARIIYRCGYEIRY